MKGKKRHAFFYKTLLPVVSFVVHRKFNYEYDKVKVNHSPYILVSNHVTNWDPLLIGLSFKEFMYYVASDQVLRAGLKSKLLNFMLAPIARAKAVNEVQTVISIMKRLRDKCNVCIFAEGVTSFNGETGGVQPSIAKLIKRSGVTLVTYRFTGSYFTFPKWALSIRNGKMQGRLVQIYSPEQLAAMSENEILQAVIKDIYVNAYEEQEKNPTAYRGKKTAEYLETILHCCPECKEFAALTSRDDRLFCKCGFHVRYTEFGYFEYPTASDKTEQPPFTTILEWSKWQKEELIRFAEKAGKFDHNVPIFTDHDQDLFLISRASHTAKQANGALHLYNNRISIDAVSGAKFEFPLNTIVEFSGFSNNTIVFSTKDKLLYEIKSNNPINMIKYIDTANYLINFDSGN